MLYLSSLLSGVFEIIWGKLPQSVIIAMSLLYANRAMALVPRRPTTMSVAVVIAGDELDVICPSEGIGYRHVKCGDSYVPLENGPFEVYASYTVPSNVMVAQLAFKGLHASDMTSPTFWKEVVVGHRSLREDVDYVLVAAGSRDVRWAPVTC